MEDFLRFTLNGLTLGSILALLALGWVVIFRVSGVLNLAQGSFMVVGALTFISMRSDHGLNLVLAALVAIAATVAVALVVDVGILRRARPGGPAAPVLITLGVAEVLAELSRKVWGNDRLLGAPFGFLPEEPVELLGVTIQWRSIFLWVCTAALLAALWYVFERTLLGRALQACAESRDGAQLVGISPTAFRTVAFVIAAALAAVAGVLLAPVTPIGWDNGLVFGLKGFIAAVVGGWTYPGAIASGLLLGLTENLSAGYIDSAWKDVITLSVLIVVLLLRPQGLLVLTGGRRLRSWPWARRSAGDRPGAPPDAVAPPPRQSVRHAHES